MCSHESPEDARRCQCTGYGFGDLPCRCGHPKSQHADGTGQCVIPAARCHEFVLRIDPNPFPISSEIIAAAVDAVHRETGLDSEVARSAAVATLFAGRKAAFERDAELDRARRLLDHYKREVARMETELRAHGVA